MLWQWSTCLEGYTYLHCLNGPVKKIEGLCIYIVLYVCIISQIHLSYWLSKDKQMQMVELLCPNSLVICIQQHSLSSSRFRLLLAFSIGLCVCVRNMRPSSFNFVWPIRRTPWNVAPNVPSEALHAPWKPAYFQKNLTILSKLGVFNHPCPESKKIMISMIWMENFQLLNGLVTFTDGIGNMHGRNGAFCSHVYLR